MISFLFFKKNHVFGYSWSTLLWYRCYYPHLSRDALSPVCKIFIIFIWFFLICYFLELCSHQVTTQEENSFPHKYVINYDTCIYQINNFQRLVISWVFLVPWTKFVKNLGKQISASSFLIFLATVRPKLTIAAAKNSKLKEIQNYLVIQKFIVNIFPSI